MIALHKDPNGQNIFTHTGHTSAGDLSDAKTAALEQKIKELESQLVIYKVKHAISIILSKWGHYIPIELYIYGES